MKKTLFILILILFSCKSNQSTLEINCIHHEFRDSNEFDKIYQDLYVFNQYSELISSFKNDRNDGILLLEMYQGFEKGKSVVMNIANNQIDCTLYNDMDDMKVLKVENEDYIRIETILSEELEKNNYAFNCDTNVDDINYILWIKKDKEIKIKLYSTYSPTILLHNSNNSKNLNKVLNIFSMVNKYSNK